jgi:hypothetical protein
MLTGVYKPLTGRSAAAASGHFRSIIVANSVEKLSQAQQASMEISAADLREMKALAEKEDVLDMLGRSLAPSIYGHDWIKKVGNLRMLCEECLRFLRLKCFPGQTLPLGRANKISVADLLEVLAEKDSILDMLGRSLSPSIYGRDWIKKVWSLRMHAALYSRLQFWRFRIFVTPVLDGEHACRHLSSLWSGCQGR